MPGERKVVVLASLPPATFDRAVRFLKDVLRECQLVLVARAQGNDPTPELSTLAERLVPDLEEIGDAFDASVVTASPGGTDLRGELAPEQAATIARLEVGLVRFRSAARAGQALSESEPDVAGVLAWVWDELADQLDGRAPRPYRPAQ